MPAVAGMTSTDYRSHAALRRARQSRFALRRQPTQYRFHGGRRDRQAPRHHALAAALPGRVGRGAARRRARVAAAAGHLHERVGARRGGGRAFLQARGRATSWCSTTRSTSRPQRSGSRPAAVSPAITACVRSLRMSATITGVCASGSDIPGVKDLVHAYVLNDFAKDERPLGGGLVRHHRRRCRPAGERPGRELPEQGAPRHAGQRVRRVQGAGSRRTGRQAEAGCDPRARRARRAFSNFGIGNSNSGDSESSWDSNAASSVCPMWASRRSSTR